MATVNFDMPQGETFSAHLVWKINDVPVNLTGYTAAMQARKHYEDTTPIFSLTEDSGISLSSLGVIIITVDDIVVDAISYGNYKYDFFITPPGGEPRKLFEGTLAVKNRVTR